MVIETKYIRKGKTIKSVEKDDKGNPVEVRNFASINEAKRESALLQKGDGYPLGSGYVLVQN